MRRPRSSVWTVVPGQAAIAVLALGLWIAGISPAQAQDLTLSLGDGTLSGVSLQLIALITLLSFAPAMVITVTCFPFIVTVLAILRQAIGLQQSPPNMLIVALALFLSWFVMEPVLTEAWTAGLEPLINGTAPPEQAFAAGMEPFRGFMGARVDIDTLDRMSALRDLTPPEQSRDAPLSILVPSFLLSEIARAFQVGFLIFLPFLVIDLVVAAVLMSMGMMMVPPAIVSLPFKLSFFVVADGWTIVSEALVTGYF
jgi:flagellar biosynthesis protein FliP